MTRADLRASGASSVLHGEFERRSAPGGLALARRQCGRVAASEHLGAALPMFETAARQVCDICATPASAHLPVTRDQQTPAKKATSSACRIAPLPERTRSLEHERARIGAARARK
jgi:hypothetical protein